MLVSVYPPLETRALLCQVRKPLPFPFGEKRCRLTHLGRGAVWLALRTLGITAGKRLAMPAYHCGSEVEAARVAGAQIEFYRVRPELTVDTGHLAEVAHRCDAVYVISHFGFEPPASFARGLGLPVIEDAAHGLYSVNQDGSPMGSASDAAIFCPRKSLGVPDGGAALVSGQSVIEGGSNRPGTVEPTAALVAGRLAAARLNALSATGKWILRRSSVTARAAAAGTMTQTVIGEWNLDSDDLRSAAAPPSRLTEHVIRRSDPDRIRASRRENYAAIVDSVAEFVPEPYRDLPNGICPLYVPVRAFRRDDATRSLWSRGIRVTEVWPVAHPLLDAEEFPETAAARRELLALPVHQAMSLDDAMSVGRQAAEVLSTTGE